jgi:hypothetical protein
LRQARSAAEATHAMSGIYASGHGTNPNVMSRSAITETAASYKMPGIVTLDRRRVGCIVAHQHLVTYLRRAFGSAQLAAQDRVSD